MNRAKRLSFHRSRELCDPSPDYPVPTNGEGSRWGRWQSLGVRLPLTISLVVIAILGVVLFAAYRQVEAALVAAGLDACPGRLRQVASLMEGLLRAPSAQIRLIASEPAIREFLKTRDDAKAAAAEAELRKLLSGTAPRDVALWAIAPISASSR